MKRFLLKIVVLTVALSISTLLRALPVASLTGVVTNTTGALVVGADVALINSATGASYHAATNSFGSYTFANIPPGPDYKITITAPGFEPYEIIDVYL